MVHFQPVNQGPRSTGRSSWRERALGVVAAVVEHVDQRVAHLARGAEDARVVALGEQLAAAAEATVEAARDADGEPLHAARERRRSSASQMRWMWLPCTL
jgi:hypothetical protein